MPTEKVDKYEIFNAAAELSDAGERSAYLAQACGNNPALEAEIAQLLEHDLQGDSLLDRSAPGTSATVMWSLTESPGDMVGPHKLLQQIGEGGMGVVWMAEQQQPVRRRVALKVIKPGMDSKAVLARFEAEQQALAMMDHQNIAKVLDAGATESGRPFFVMELVHGVPITTFCEKNRCTVRQRLELFIPVCQAIQHAHQKGIIHRDIKPTNVLVTIYDDKPVPKVIDFGIAKAIDQRLTERTLFTQYGTIVGTLEYIPPEQAELNAFGVDTRSDVYSLGALLYELLTGTPPLDRSSVRELAWQEVLKKIQEEEPLRPSLRLSSSASLPQFAEMCHTTPAALPQMLGRELDWVVMKCLEKDRTRRYETANGLARDLQRYLADEAVEACPPTFAYRLQKGFQKHRRLLVTAGSFLILLIAATCISAFAAYSALNAKRQLQVALDGERLARQTADDERQRADQTVASFRAATSVTNEGYDFHRRRNWSEAHARFSRAIEIQRDLNTPFIQRGDLYLSLGLWDRAAADFRQRFQDSPRADSQTLYEHALLQFYSGKERDYRDALKLLSDQHADSSEFRDRQAVLRASLLGAEPVGNPSELAQQAEEVAVLAKTPWFEGLVGRAQLKAGNFESAEEHCREAIELGKGAPSGVDRLAYPNLASALFHLGKKREAAEALSIATTARAQWLETLLSKQPGNFGLPTLTWSNWLEFEIHLREARTLIEGENPGEDQRVSELYQRGLAGLTNGNVNAVLDLGRQYVKHKEWDAAAAEFVKIFDGLSLDEFPVAIRELQLSVEMIHNSEVFTRIVELRPNDHRPWFARSCYLASRRSWSEAVAAYQRTLAFFPEQPQESGHLRWRAGILHQLGAVLILAGDLKQYEALCVGVIDRNANTGDFIAARDFSGLLSLRPSEANDPTVAIRMAERAVAEQPHAWNYFGLGIAQHRAGKNAEALKTLNQSLNMAPNWAGRAQSHLGLTLASYQLGRLQDANLWLSKGQAAQRELDRSIADTGYGYAASFYLGDWLTSLVLLDEVTATLNDNHGSSPKK